MTDFAVSPPPPPTNTGQHVAGKSACNACQGSGLVATCCGSFETNDHGILGQETVCCGSPERDYCDACNGTGESP